LVAVFALLGGVVFLHRGASASQAAPMIKPLHPLKKHLGRRVAHPTTTKAAAKPSARKGVKKAPKKQPAIVDGMPRSLASALARHAVVVVSLVASDSAVDVMAEREAEAGAAEADAGFVTINVTNGKAITALTTLVATSQAPTDRLLDDPAVLVFQRPNKLFVRFNGYVDAQTVAQAAVNATPEPVAQRTAGAASRSLPDSWVQGANEVCTELRQQVASTPFPTSAAEILPYAEHEVAAAQTAVAKLHALRAPKAMQPKVREMLASYDSMLSDVQALLAAAKRGDASAGRALAKKAQAEGEHGDSLALSLGATACASSRNG
jgi:hypothetical protein